MASYFQSKNKKVAIIGGGLSGLLTAYYLSEKGNDVHIFEKRKHLGGELSSTMTGKWPIENFYHHLFLNHQETLNLYKRLGLRNSLEVYESQIGLVKNSRIYPFWTPSHLLKLPFLTIVTKFRLGLFVFLLPKLPFKFFEQQTAKTLISKCTGKSGWVDFWEPIFRLKFGTYASSVSATWFWGRLADRSTSYKNGENLIYPKKGFNGLIEKIQDQIKKAGVSVKTNREIQEIKKINNRFEIEEELFDQVICAIPLPVAAKIAPLGQKEKNSYLKVKHLSVITVLLFTSEKITEYYWTNILDPNPFGVVVEHTNLIPAKSYNTHLVYLGRYLEETDPLWQKEDREVAEIFIREFIKTWPNAEGKITSYKVFRDRYAQPVIEKGFAPSPYSTSVSGLFFLTSAHIYPFDRGIERTISASKKLADSLSNIEV